MKHEDAWRVYESTLQSYRSIFISSQSFMLAVGANFFKTDRLLLLALAAMSLVVIWWFWHRIVRSRHLIVDYHKYQIDNKIEGICSWQEYVSSKEKRKQANEQLGIRTNWRPTRWKLDCVLPVIFSLIWIGMVLFTFLDHDKNAPDKISKVTIDMSRCLSCH